MTPLYVYVDVDNTLVRSFSGKRIPISSTINHIRELKRDGAILYCWSSVGADYAKAISKELNLLDVFTAFLPKPHIAIDDREINQWKYFQQVHPMSCRDRNLGTYKQNLQL